MADFNKTTCVLDFELPVPGKVCGCSKNTHLFFNLFKASQDQMKTQLFKIYKDKIPTHVRLYIEHLLATQQPQERSGEEDHAPAGNAINESLEQQMHYGQRQLPARQKLPLFLCLFTTSKQVKPSEMNMWRHSPSTRKGAGKETLKFIFLKYACLNNWA